MTENRVGFLFNIASTLSTNNATTKLLRSYYLTQCVELTNGVGLPVKQFSTKARCRHCRLEWARDTEVKVQRLKTSKSKRRKSQSRNKNNSENNSLHNMEMEQICTFCKQSTISKLFKPEKEYSKVTSLKIEHNISTIQKKIHERKVLDKLKVKITEQKKAAKTALKKSSTINVYSNAMDVFSLKNEKNSLSTIKEPVKVIKNNKKKKDKYAGLCQKAVLASAKLKQQKEISKSTSQNKLNLFLKPSS